MTDDKKPIRGEKPHPASQEAKDYAAATMNSFQGMPLPANLSQLIEIKVRNAYLAGYVSGVLREQELMREAIQGSQEGSSQEKGEGFERNTKEG